MSIMRCVFCELDQDTDFNTGMTITIHRIKRSIVEDGNVSTLVEVKYHTDKDTFHFCGECRDPDEISQLLTDLNIDHTIE